MANSRVEMALTSGLMLFGHGVDAHGQVGGGGAGGEVGDDKVVHDMVKAMSRP